MKHVLISTTLLADLAQMARAHVEDIETGIQEGLYQEEDNQDLPRKQAGIDCVDSLLEAANSTVGRRSASSFYERLLEAFPGFQDDDDVNGGDLVEFIGENLERLRQEAEARSGSKTCVPIAHWRAMQESSAPLLTHEACLHDTRATDGSVQLDIGALEGPVDDILTVTAAVKDNPLLPRDQGIEQGVQCLHIFAGSDDPAFSIYKIGERVLLRPMYDDLKVERFVHANGELSRETFYWVN